jgi:hypothetical protein
MYRNGFSGPAPTLLNTGTLRRTEGAGQITVEFMIENNGLVSIETGQMAFTGGGTSGAEHIGSWSTSSGSQITFSGSNSFSLGSSVPLLGSGSVNIVNVAVGAGTIEGPKVSVSDNGTLEVNGSSPSTLAGLVLTTGTLRGSGEMDVTESFSASLGFVDGPGVLTLESGVTGATVSGDGMVLYSTLINKGRLTITNGSGIGGEEDGKFVNDGTLTINGEEKRYTGMYRDSFSGAVPVLVNVGMVQRTEGSGEIQVQWAFENYGAIGTVTGKIRFEDPIVTREAATQYGGAEKSLCARRAASYLWRSGELRHRQ